MNEPPLPSDAERRGAAPTEDDARRRTRANAVSYVARLARRSAADSDSVSLPLERLAQRELQILACLVQDQGLRDIANQLCLAHSTVRNHVQHMLSKTGTHSRQELVARFLLMQEQASPDVDTE